MMMQYYQRLVHRYAIILFQFRFTHESNKLKKSFPYKCKFIFAVQT